MPNDATNIIRVLREKQEDINYANVCFQHGLSIALRDTDSPVIVSRWPQLRGRGVARGFDFMKTYSRSRHPRASARVRPPATIRQRAPTFIVRGAGRFLIVGGGGTRYELLTRLILGYAPTYLNSNLLSRCERELSSHDRADPVTIPGDLSICPRGSWGAIFAFESDDRDTMS